MPAFAIVHADIHDAAEYAKYAALAGPVVAKFGGEFLARGGASAQMEGTGRARNVIIRFPDMDTARAFYASADYQQAMAHARPSSTRDYTIVEGI